MVQVTESMDMLKHQLLRCHRVKNILLQQNNQFKAAICQVPVGVMISNGTDNTVLMVNPEFEQMVGLPKNQLIGKHFTREFSQRGGKIFYPGQNEAQSDSFSKHFLSRKHIIAKDFELILQKPGGNKICVSMSSSPVLGEEKEVIAIISVLNDVTAKKKEENSNRHAKKRLEIEVEKKTKDLKTMNSQLETIFNASSESLWVCDGKGSVISINHATEELLGIHASDVVGKDINDLVKEGFMDQSVTGKVLESGCQTSIIQNALKTKKQLLVTGSPVFDDAGQISMVIVNERDLTRLNQLQEELQQVKKETNRFKQELEELHLQELKTQEIIAYSREMQDILMICRKLANMDISNILILGESGTGKGLLAKYIHNSNKSQKGPIVQINCAALPESLLEAELFGYEKGAFTGARDQGKIGLFEMAQCGTLFLDEIGDLPLALQAKLLHCLEEKEIMHLGGLKPIKINCTVIAATNVDLVSRVQNRTFRKDLYFRLNTFPINIPPLRERPEDILELVLFFLDKYNEKYNSDRKISSAELKKIQTYSFPGNVRELKNFIKKMIVLTDTNILSSPVGEAGIYSLISTKLENASQYKGKSLKQALAEFEKNILSNALGECGTTRSLAEFLSMSQSQVVRKLSEHDLSHRLKRKKVPVSLTKSASHI